MQTFVIYHYISRKYLRSAVPLLDLVVPHTHTSSLLLLLFPFPASVSRIFYYPGRNTDPWCICLFQIISHGRARRVVDGERRAPGVCFVATHTTHTARSAGARARVVSSPPQSITQTETPSLTFVAVPSDTSTQRLACCPRSIACGLCPWSWECVSLSHLTSALPHSIPVLAPRRSIQAPHSHRDTRHRTRSIAYLPNHHRHTPMSL